jgi:hypothetical protein
MTGPTQRASPGVLPLLSSRSIDSKRKRRGVVSAAILTVFCLPYAFLMMNGFRAEAGPGTLTERFRHTLSSLRIPSGPNTNCDVSMAESNGFFCESGALWKRRHANYLSMQRKQVNKYYDEPAEGNKYKPYAASLRNWFQQNYEPNFSCAEEERVGNGDGGKWICSPHRINEIAVEQRCLVYSIGSNNDFQASGSHPTGACAVGRIRPAARPDAPAVSPPLSLRRRSLNGCRAAKYTRLTTPLRSARPGNLPPSTFTAGASALR